jgi:hypothetical protein
MNKEREIQKRLTEMLQRGTINMNATVKTVDEDNYTCTVEVDGLEFYNVRLTAAVGGEKGFVAIPRVNSTVVVGMVGNETDLTVIHYTGLSKLFLNADEILFNDGLNGGLINLTDLVAKLNALVSDFNSHVHSGVIVAVSGGSGAPAVGTPGNSGSPTATTDTFDKTDFENTDTKH